MALFNHLFPYTNLHDINLDWIISIIKSIDPAVIKALQELTPDTIEQVTQLVSEAQNYAISAQSSASDANTAKENAAASAAEAAHEATEAAADAALANADAVRAENAKTAVENSLTPTVANANPSDHLTTVGLCYSIVSGRTATFFLDATLSSKGSEYWTPVATLPHSIIGTVFGWGLLSGATRIKTKIENNVVSVESGTISTVPQGILIFDLTYYTA